MFSCYAAVLEHRLNPPEIFSALLIFYSLINLCWHSKQQISSSKTETTYNTLPSSIKQSHKIVDITDSTTLLPHIHIGDFIRSHLLRKTPLHLPGGADDDSDNVYETDNKKNQEDEPDNDRRDKPDYQSTYRNPFIE
jgi:hypothetical protein